jgi:lysyl-tRNA synthetase class 2
MQATKNPDPFPHKFHISISIPNFRTDFEPVLKGEKDKHLEEKVCNLSGRVISIRASGKHLKFIIIKGEGVKLQILANAKWHKGTRSFDDTYDIIRRGDIVGVIGHPCTSISGELSIAPHDLLLLAPCLHMLPKEEITVKPEEE